jgi:hypothetical protein
VLEEMQNEDDNGSEESVEDIDHPYSEDRVR